MSDQPTVQFPPIEEPGPRRRRSWRVALVAAVATVVLVVPIALYLLLRGPGPSAQPGVPVPAPSTPAASPTSSAPAPKPSTSARPPDGRISARALGNAVLDIPAWPADNVQGPSGELRFRDGVVTVHPRPAAEGQPPSATHLALLGVTYGDVDGDGAAETIAGIGCLIEGGSKQLIAFDRDPGGRIVTIGRIVATTGEIRDIRDDGVRVSGGVVRARVSDYQRCCDDRTPQVWQTRGYALRTGDFRQVSGPTGMTANPYVTQTAVHTGDLTLGPIASGYRYGTVSVTVTHGWGTRPVQLRIWFRPSEGLERAGTTWPPVTAEPNGFTVTLPPPPDSGSRTYRFAFRAPASVTTAALGVETAGLSRTGAYLSEAIPWDNTGTVIASRVD